MYNMKMNKLNENIVMYNEMEYIIRKMEELYI